MRRVLLVRGANTVDGDAAELARRGAVVVSDPYVTTRTCADEGVRSRVHEVFEALERPGAWLVCASSWGVRALAEIAGQDELRQAVRRGLRAGARFAAVGPSTARAMELAGAVRVLAPDAPHTAVALMLAMADLAPGSAILPRSQIGGSVLRTTLASRGWDIVDRVVYTTSTVPKAPASARDVEQGQFAAVVLRSPSAVRALVAHADVPASTLVIAGGPTTAEAARAAGLTVAATTLDSTPTGIAAAWEGLWAS